MAVSVRMDPLLERELELAAKRQGLTKSQFIIHSVEHALGKRDSYALMQSLKVEEERRAYGRGALTAERRAARAFATHEQPYDTESSRKQLLSHLKQKHGGGAG